MFDQLVKLVADNAQDLIVNNSAVPNQHNDAAINEAASAIQNGLAGAVQQGNLQDIMGMFSNGQNAGSNPLVQNITQQLAGSLGSKLGVDGAQAQNIATSLIPMIVGQLVNKTNDPNDNSFDLNDIMSKVTGGNSGGIDFKNVLTQFQQGGGNMDLGNIAGQLLDGNKSGLGGLLGNIFGK